MDDLGARLKEAREQRGVPLKTIATRTKISVAALEALERNDFSRLPGGIFGRAFVRAYALEIGLDPETTVADFQVHLDRSEREAAERQQIHVDITEDDREFLARQQRALRLLQIGAVVLGLAIVALGIWQAPRLWKRLTGDPAPATAPAAVPQQSSEVLPSSPTPPAPLSEAVPLAGTPAADQAVTASAPAGAAPSAPVAGRMVVEFVLTGDCWVVASVDGGRSVSELMHAGDRRRFEAEREVFLDVGNAGVVQLTIDGAPAKPLGGPGVHVQKTITRVNAGSFLS
jgi:cytoskeletal protein RodZ